MTTKQFFYFLAFFLLIPSVLLQNQLQANDSLPVDTSFSVKENISLFSGWQAEEVLHLQLTADFSHLLANKKTGEYQAASLTVHHKTDKAYTTPVKIKARGKYRRRVCDFPPLKIKLKEDVVEGIAVGNYKTFKLVTHCMEETPTKKYILKEYLAYQLYQKLTNQSLRTQLVEISYSDESGELTGKKRYGILIEDTDELEDRLQADDCDCGFDLAKAKDQDAAARLALFQLMIGNTDWDFAAHRNMKILRSRIDQELIPVPYDFDFAGLVSASYAFPNPDYPVKSTYDRVMLGKGFDDAAIDKAIQLFQSKKIELLATVQNLKGLNKVERKKINDYIHSFFQLLDQPLTWEHQRVFPYEVE